MSVDLSNAFMHYVQIDQLVVKLCKCFWPVSDLLTVSAQWNVDTSCKSSLISGLFWWSYANTLHITFCLTVLLTVCLWKILRSHWLTFVVNFGSDFVVCLPHLSSVSALSGKNVHTVFVFFQRLVLSLSLWYGNVCSFFPILSF